jgi:hypothetical protein
MRNTIIVCVFGFAFAFAFAAGCVSEEASSVGTVEQSITAQQLLALTTSCTVAGGTWAKDDAGASTVSMCKLDGAYFWKADMDVDCDGKRTAACNETTDPWFQNQTSAVDSKGGWLDAAALPYVVIPLPSSRFDYSAHGIQLGSVVAVIYGGKVAYGVFGDEGPEDIIGESSYAMAASLGIDPDPANGGTDGPVTYIVFTGPSGVVSKIEDHAAAVAIGEARASLLIGGGGGGEGGGGGGGGSSCAFAVTKNVYDGASWWGTITFTNNGPAAASKLRVSFAVPSGVHCDFAPSGWTYAQSGSTCTYTRSSGTLAAGGSLALNYSTDSQSFTKASNVAVHDSVCAP